MAEDRGSLGPAERAAEAEEAARAAHDVGQVLGHPKFRELIEEIERAPESQRRDLANRLAYPDELRRRGIPVPPGRGKLNIRIFDAATGEDLAVRQEPS